MMKKFASARIYRRHDEPSEILDESAATWASDKPESGSPW
jgi:hypothetical protein